jgi:hypothetical protein
MADCDHPGCDGDDNLPNTCNFCDGQFCADHRLPEKHYCVPEKPAPESSPEFRDTDTDDERSSASPGTGTQTHPDKRRPSSSDPPTARSPAVETKHATQRTGRDSKSRASLSDRLDTTKARLAYGVRRFRYYIWRTVGIGMTLTKYAALLAIISVAVIGALGIVQPGLLTPLSDAGLPVPDGGAPSSTGVEPHQPASQPVSLVEVEPERRPRQ